MSHSVLSFQGFDSTWQDIDCLPLDAVFEHYDGLYACDTIHNLYNEACAVPVPQSPLSEEYNHFHQTDSIICKNAGNQSDKAAAVQTHFNNAAQNVQLQHLEQSDSQGSSERPATMPVPVINSCSDSRGPEGAVPPARCVTKRRSIDESCRTSLAHGDPAKAHSGKSSTQAAADYTVLKRAKQMHDDSPRSLPSSFSGILQPFSIVKTYGASCSSGLEQLNNKIRALEASTDK
eukprot:jgi/Chrzof1/767/Cz01g28040.t1